MLKQLEGFDASIKHSMQAWGVPGAAVAVIKDGEVIHCQGYGFRDIEKGLPVTSKTLFAIGSTTKAFTAMAAGLLVDEGKLEWDKPIRNYIPWFKLYDPVAGERLTVRDLLTHRSGLPRHELVWYRSTASRKEIVERLQYLEPTCDFRTRWQYQNMMITTAGYLVGVIAGMTYEEFVTDRIFKPLGMENSNFSVEASQQNPDFSYPYQTKDGVTERIPFCNIDQIGPAGSINSNLEDMSRWIQLHLNKGKVGDKQFISEASLQEMHSPQMVIGDFASGETPEITFQNYGLCWSVYNYRGYKVIEHSGGIDGFITEVALVPEKNLGVVMLSNENRNGIPIAGYREVIDRVLGLEPIDWNGRVKAEFDKLKHAQEEAEQKSDGDRKPDTQPSHPIEAYAGDYAHPGYGLFRVEVKDGKLIGNFNTMDFPLEHYHYDIFDFKITSLDMPFKATFQTDLKGNIGSLSIPFEASVKEIVFTRQPDKSLQNKAFLEPFAGEYELMGQTLTVYLRGETTLVANIPGGGEIELVPYQGLEFTLKSMPGAGLTFQEDETGQVTGVLVTQPGMMMMAKRK